MKLLVCEGKDDQALLQGLVGQLGLEGVTIEPCEGVPSFDLFVRQLPKRGEFTRREVASLGIILDADLDRAACWQRIRERVQEAFQIELRGENQFAGDRPRIGGFIVGSGPSGNLEDLLLEACRDKPGFSCLSDYFACLAKAMPDATFKSKARFRAWMAAQSKYDLRAGKAAEEGYIPFDSPVFDELKSFLRAL